MCERVCVWLPAPLWPSCSCQWITDTAPSMSGAVTSHTHSLTHTYRHTFVQRKVISCRSDCSLQLFYADQTPQITHISCCCCCCCRTQTQTGGGHRRRFQVFISSSWPLQTGSKDLRSLVAWSISPQRARTRTHAILHVCFHFFTRSTRHSSP